ncbi:MAG: 50S ribosomal protein L11 methyltransferase [Candidatus Pelagadaptatus aseana]|uniref:class I SAM-dependent methyltransferase n=1 Tax=Candidatus Pelagadaptatus aseana TaxID=3120508 RepID=UPI0039B15304
MREVHQHLSEIVSAIVPEARIEKYRLPNDTGIDLFLMNEDYPTGRLPYEAAMKLMEQPFYWAFCWASGAVLAQYIMANPELVQGKRVVDFGCGSGVVAIAASKAGASEVVACDIDPLAILATRENARINDVDLVISEDFDQIEGHIDIIIVADVLYDRDNLPWLDRFSARADDVLVADSRVKNFDYPPYKQVAQVDACTLPDLDESLEFRDVRIYRA